MRAFVATVAVALSAATLQSQPRAQQAKVAAPADVMRAFLNAYAQERFVDAARHLDLDALVAERRSILQTAREQAPRRMITAEDMLATDKQMPRAVAEYQASVANRTVIQPFEYLSFQWANVRDTSVLKELTPLDLGTRWLEARSFRYQSERARTQSPDCASNADTDSLPPRRPPAEVVGVVVIRDTAFAVFRDTALSERFAGFPIEPRVAVLVRRGSWRVLPRPELMGLEGFALTCGYVVTETFSSDSTARRKPPE